MRLSSKELRELELVLSRIEDGTASLPRVGGTIGRFLRSYSISRGVAVHRLARGARGRWISGDMLMPIDVVPIMPLRLIDAGSVAGSATVGVVASETLAATMRITLWGSGRTANWLEQIWRRDSRTVVELSGAYRWHAPERITAGEAVSELLGVEREWHQIRCLKFTGDDIGREPKAAAYHVDWTNAPFGVKAYRCLAVHYDGRWRVVPGLRETPDDIEIEIADQLAPRGGLGLVLAWAQPWMPTRWHVVASREASEDDVLAHGIAWADHVRELLGEPPVTGEVMRALAQRARTAGITDITVERAASSAAVVRQVDPRAKPYAAWLRGVA